MKGALNPVLVDKAEWGHRDTYEKVVFFQAFEGITVLFVVMKIMNLSVQQRCGLSQQKQQDQ